MTAPGTVVQESALTETRARQSPHDAEAELSVLGGLLLLPDKFIDIEGKLDAADFSDESHQKIFSAMLTLHSAGKPIDVLLLREELTKRGDLEKIGGVAALAALSDSAPTGINVPYYAEIVREKSLLRRLINSAVQIVEKASDPGAIASSLIDGAEQAIMSVAEKNIHGEPQVMKTIMSSTLARLQQLADKHALAADVVRTDYYELDEMLACLHGGELIVVAGRPSMGKSTFALNIARRVAMQGRQGVLIFSLEMTAINMATNVLAAHAKIDAEKLRKPADLSHNEWSEIGHYMQELADANLIIDDTSLLSIAEMRGKARRVKQKHSVNLIIVDYLQLMQGGALAQKRSREQEISEISRGLKALAKELNVPVIALSQLNRNSEDRTDKRPQMSDLRESGAIEQDADVILLIHRPDRYDPQDRPGEAEIIIAKQRNGPTGKINLTFVHNQLRFESLTHLHHGDN